MSETSLSAKWNSYAPQLLSILRIVAAFMFIFNGAMKLFAYPVGMPPDNGTAVFMSETWIGGVLEFAGGILMLIGLFSRPVAFILAGEMAVAYFQYHFPQGALPIINGGTGAVLYCFIWLYISAAGPGPWSIDAMRK